MNSRKISMGLLVIGGLISSLGVGIGPTSATSVVPRGVPLVPSVWIERGGIALGGDSCGNSDLSSITSAVAEAQANDVIHVCAGTYTEPEINVVVDNLTFVGEGTSPTDVVIDGYSETEVESSRHRLFDARGLSITFENLTLQNGLAEAESDWGSYGGAVYAYQVTMQNVIVANNDAQGGGAVFVSSDGITPPCGTSATSDITSTEVTVADCAPVAGLVAGPAVTMTRSLFANNGDGSAIVGGAIYAMGGTVTATESMFTANTAIERSVSLASTDGAGGAIQADSVSVHGSTFDSNVALLHGGAISASSVEVQGIAGVTASVFTGNQAVGVDATESSCNGLDVGFGGAIWADAVDVSHGSFDTNTADCGGAIASAAPSGDSLPNVAALTPGVVTISNSLFDSNDASQRGAGVFNYSTSGSTTVVNSTFTLNDAGFSGGGVDATGSLTVKFNTFVNNTAGTAGGTFWTPVAPATVSNIFVFAAADETQAMQNGCLTYEWAPSPDTTNLTTNYWCPGSVVTEAALDLGTLADNGGLTKTIALGETSVAIDTSDLTVCPSILAAVEDITTDQRGIGRAVGAACDVGAFEYYGTLTLNSEAGTIHTLTIPAGLTEIHVALVGGGGGGGGTDGKAAGGGGGGGEVVTCDIAKLTETSVVTYYLGLGGAGGAGTGNAGNGEASWLKVDETEVCRADGGSAGKAGQEEAEAGFGGDSGTPKFGGLAALCPVSIDECSALLGVPLGGGGGGGAKENGGNGSFDSLRLLASGGAGGTGLAPSGTHFGEGTNLYGGGGGGGSVCFDTLSLGGAGGSGGGGTGTSGGCSSAGAVGLESSIDGTTGGGGGGGAGTITTGGNGGSGTGEVRIPLFTAPPADPIYVCLSKTYVVYGAHYFEPKVYYCVEDKDEDGGESGPTEELPVDEDPAMTPSDGYSTLSGDSMIDSGSVSELTESAEDIGITIDGPSPLHYDHIPEGWHKVDPDDYPGTTPPTCTTDYEQGDEVVDSGMPITCSGGDAGEGFEFDYSLLEEGLQIYPARLTVKPTHLKVPYLTPEPNPYEYTVKGFKLGETAETAAGFQAPTCDSTYDGTAPAGSRFDISCEGASANNYVFRYKTSHIHVEKAKLDLKPESFTVTYGDPAPTYSFGLSDGPDVVVAQAGIEGFVPPQCTSTYAPGTNAGTVEIECLGAASNNFEFVPSKGTVTVLKAPLRVTPRVATATYGTVSPTIGFDLSGYVAGDFGPGSGYRAPVCSPVGYTPTTPTGTQLTVTCTGGTSQNYQFDTSATSAFTVTKASATITAANAMLPYGSASPTWGYTVTGLRNGETAATMSGLVAPTCVSTHAPTMNAGSVAPVNCSGAVSANYTFTYVAGKATITKATLTVTPNSLTITKGSRVPVYTTVISGWMNGQGSGNAAGYKSPVCKSNYTTRSPVGTYTITCTGGSATNYAFSHRTGTLTVR